MKTLQGKARNMGAWDDLDGRLRPAVEAHTREYERLRPALDRVTAAMLDRLLQRAVVLVMGGTQSCS